MNRMLKSGWPTTTDYTENLNLLYSERTKAQDLYTRLLLLISELAIDGQWFSDTTAVRIGPCAAISVPRALYLLGLIEEGGERVELPSEWPVLTTEPERIDVNGERVF